MAKAGIALFSIAPMYLQRDDHRIGLVRLLTIALRVLTLLENVIRQNLQKQERAISGLYAGNPQRRTTQPTAELVLEAFGNVTLTIVHAPQFIQCHIMPLSSIQQDLLALGGFSPLIYLQVESAQQLGEKKTDHLEEARPEALSFPDDQRSQATFPQNSEKILPLIDDFPFPARK